MKKILIVDCESQYTKLIAKCVRNLNEYCEIIHHSKFTYDLEDIYGIIFSGSWQSVTAKDSADIQWDKITSVPTLAICYSSQHLARHFHGDILRDTGNSEYGKTEISITGDNPIWRDIPETINVWMSHNDTIELQENVIAHSSSGVAAFAFHNHTGLLFHPEVYHTECGSKIINNFLDICGCEYTWTASNYITDTISQIRETVGDDQVIMAISGGVDSSVAATLIHRAIGDQLHCVFIDTGLMRENEANEVMTCYKNIQLNVSLYNQSNEFFEALNGVTDPEEKRRIIGGLFIGGFTKFSENLTGIKWLGQGTIYPDVIESSSGARKIKSHHNVGGLPSDLPYKLIEPLKFLFKDEVRRIGLELGIPENIINRHPFPGPGLAIRIIGSITPERVKILQQADHIYTQILRRYDLYDKIWQAGAILLPIKTVGVMGDCRTYEFTLALRAVTSVDGMTADVYPIPHNILCEISGKIINTVKGINRVTYDISSKPPATIEWE
jgi:GMP synthase (glutamine-hydrolysing)